MRRIGRIGGRGEAGRGEAGRGAVRIGMLGGVGIRGDIGAGAPAGVRTGSVIVFFLQFVKTSCH